MKKKRAVGSKKLLNKNKN